MPRTTRTVTVRAMGLARNGSTPKGNTRWIVVDENHQQWHTAPNSSVAANIVDTLGDLPAWIELGVDAADRIETVTRTDR